MHISVGIEEVKKVRNGLFGDFPVYDEIQEAVLQQEFRGLEAIRQFPLMVLMTCTMKLISAFGSAN